VEGRPEWIIRAKKNLVARAEGSSVRYVEFRRKYKDVLGIERERERDKEKAEKFANRTLYSMKRLTSRNKFLN